ncbi:hypothetical protein Patl1_12793 [Pistacia atlantica]|uniref:Uncharacterized protein n=1 Tax=Pistacia atlantica TaxID=434234 RepID=A0ACC1AWG7_9ROSI|nr:hypothetical protein Patl1_12793 [Pistacia atlantica]
MEENRNKKKGGKAVIVGGSIAGVSCAHSLLSAGWDVVLLEKSSGPPTGSPNGAGLGLDPLAQRIIHSWLPHCPHLLHKSTVPLTIDQAKVLQTNEIIEMESDLLVAADGCLSSIRQSFLPDLKLRYSGYCAWRGVLDFSGNKNSEIIQGMRSAYPDLGKCLYFDLGSETHSVFYELLNNRLNWIWYVNQAEPELKGNSVTLKVRDDIIKNMHQEAEKVWAPELVKVMKETKEPFINAVYDCDPLKQIFWSNVVLIGDAAHPTTPHGLRSTNMSILDAAVLGKCLEKWGVENLFSALEEYQSIRLPVTSKQVLHSRRLGRIKQGLTLPDRDPFNPKTATPQECQELQQKTMPFFADIPSVLVDSAQCSA